MRAALAFLGVVLLLAGGAFWWLKFAHHAPQASLVTPVTVLGRKTPIDIAVQCDPPGLRNVEVRLRAGGTIYQLLSRSYPAVSWRGSRLTQTQLHVAPDLFRAKVPEGPATLEVLVSTYAWHFLPPKAAPVLSVPLRVDLTPPQIELLTTQYNVRLGGTELAVFRQSPDTVRSGIQVDNYFFPATTGYFADQSIALAFFAVPQDLTVAARPQLVASDAAGNERTVYLPCHIIPRHFAQRTLEISDDFLSRKVPEIEQASGLPRSANLLKGYLYINRELRKQNAARIRELTAKSVPEPLWSGAFHRQPDSASLSSFADRRTYTYHGQVIDHETHLGYDLASVKMAPVAAAQNGIVVYAANLGIYGNAVILDHGLGIFSLYGHMSSFNVKKGDHVTVGQTLGRTGQTGLAGGDHLHFSMLLYGVQIDPVEWWDPHWLRGHVTPKLTMFPRAVRQPVPPPPGQPAAPAQPELPHEQAHP